MIVLHSIVPTAMRRLEIKKKDSSIVSVLNGVEHVAYVQKSLCMPFGVYLHASDIDTVLGAGNGIQKIRSGCLTRVKEQPFASVIQRPGPGHEFTCDSFSASLYAGDALQQP